MGYDNGKHQTKCLQEYLFVINYLFLYQTYNQHKARFCQRSDLPAWHSFQSRSLSSNTYITAMNCITVCILTMGCLQTSLLYRLRRLLGSFSQCKHWFQAREGISKANPIVFRQPIFSRELVVVISVPSC